MQNEEKIDLKKIQPEKPLEDLDQESQAKIKQMMYDEKQKRLGLPTSEEQVCSTFSTKLRHTSIIDTDYN